ncbi:Alw26I/Eco31I/Esp3I family type II restriction adenine-specific DNA-methyltransferase [Pseudomonas promysalinigenes]|uniref:Alw26I/Eco31I/Esp3I family type II restriction adenine-specific DNA-methyltransferase n=1 Tax=Pseudomonas promysalinigenes TaxID=485898 RepID=UPI001646D708|nr:Alw26I/Eco31I/Esp3I family type II restriction adenine-specific DNA-methyltransferase [Pseudomonas promysalinigenes]QXI34382.1 Alw26I/Eco31I/Esp3I family type II restriction adenine-specific DNA-methyltransferase [Pseudomonas promysalinigenes]
MLHLNHVSTADAPTHDNFIKKASGRYYTGESVGRQLARTVARSFAATSDLSEEICVIDPFGGDGRLLGWLIDAWAELCLPRRKWRLQLWDISDLGFDVAREKFDKLRQDGLEVECDFIVDDAFRYGPTCDARFDIVITNPPWELLKPDRREVDQLREGLREEYVSNMRLYDKWISRQFPRSQPRRKFAGWGTNLSRVGLELSFLLARRNGVIGAVLPASLLADDQSSVLRQHLLLEHALRDVTYYPAESKLYESADVASITIVVEAYNKPMKTVPITTYSACGSSTETAEVSLEPERLLASDFVLPVAFGASTVRLMSTLMTRFSTWGELEQDRDSGFWAGREIDETGSANWLTPISDIAMPFLKGRMIDRFSIRHRPTLSVAKQGWTPPPSVKYERIAWRDISRPNQKRRLIATIVPAGWVLGNSLGVAFFSGGRPTALRALLGIMNSTTFELLLRANLATGHVSLSSLRKVPVPKASQLEADSDLGQLVNAALLGDTHAEVTADAYVALRVYGLTPNEYSMVLDLFSKLSNEEKEERKKAFERLSSNVTNTKTSSGSTCGNSSHIESKLERESSIIFNHHSAKLSELDLQMVRAVPEGGNWKNIPESIPSKRLEQIRESYKRGEGSRSTYYGRLRRDMPSYTINTYFNRPGNGCHVHPTQDRVLSQREAARLQSFPDSYEFMGGQGAICTQIGNAVPPLLAYRIAQTLGTKGGYIDLFSGAGGMGFGFKWAGWRPIIANDIEAKYLSTYSRNVHERTVTGSITTPSVFNEIVKAAKNGRRAGEPLWVLGGPPCQGFSTAGNRRSMEDSRNHLFSDYVRFLEEVQPDGFVFENVTGLLNMQGGKVFAAVKEAFSSVMPSIYATVISADEHGIPQRRKRVILVGFREERIEPWQPPEPITSSTSSGPTLFSNVQVAVSVEEAISDLPTLKPAEDGSSKPYQSAPASTYQALMRGLISPAEYFARLEAGDRY